MLQVENLNLMLCSSCFSPLNGIAMICPVCGYRDGEIRETPGALALNEILLGKYTIGRILGRGGFGITYLAYNLHENQKVAVKEYLPDGLAYRTPGSSLVTAYSGDKMSFFQSGAEKFYNEAEMLSRFAEHPSIIHVHEFFYENNTAYFSMEYVEGMDLKQYIVGKGGTLDFTEVVSILLPLLDALQTLHQVGILHRDISPDNIYITTEGHVKLLDFGAARQVMGEKSQSLSVILKQGFAPVEQYQKRGKQGPWTDIYALGATVYYALTGIVPDDVTSRFDDEVMLDPMKFNPTVPPEFIPVINKAMSLRWHERYQQTEEVLEDLKKIPIANIEEASKEISETRVILSVQEQIQKDAAEEAIVQDIAEGEDDKDAKDGADKKQAAPINKETHRDKQRVAIPKKPVVIATGATIICAVAITVFVYGRGYWGRNKLVPAISPTQQMETATLPKETENERIAGYAAFPGIPDFGAFTDEVPVHTNKGTCLYEYEEPGSAQEITDYAKLLLEEGFIENKERKITKEGITTFDCTYYEHDQDGLWLGTYGREGSDGYRKFVGVFMVASNEISEEKIAMLFGGTDSEPSPEPDEEQATVPESPQVESEAPVNPTPSDQPSRTAKVTPAPASPTPSVPITEEKNRQVPNLPVETPSPEPQPTPSQPDNSDNTFEEPFDMFIDF